MPSERGSDSWSPFISVGCHHILLCVCVFWQEEERSRNAAEGREGIEKFEASLKEVLAQK